MNILFVASVAIITPKPAESRKLFMDTLGLPLKPHAGDDYYFSESIPGAKHFGVWAARSSRRSLLWHVGMALRPAGPARVFRV
ncbi:MAG: hypothetical protein V7608_2698 [Hyphomicrobiales bacterium]